MSSDIDTRDIETVIITGGAGFLGLHLAHEYSARGARDIVLVDIDDFRKDEYPDDVTFVSGDVRNIELIDELFEKHNPDAVIHGAAALPLWSPEKIYDVNLRGTLNILTAAQNHGIDPVVFISSTAVYGIPDKHPIDEDDPLVGVGAYGETKIEAENICKSFRNRGMTVPIIRPKTFIGTERLGVFQILYDWVESGKKIPVIGDGNNRYQLLEVEDLTDAIWRASAFPPERSNDTFNIGATDFDTVKEDVGALCQYAQTGAEPMPTPAKPVKTALRAFESVGLSPLYEWVYGTADKDSYVAVDRAKEKLDWHPDYSNAQALIRSYQWYIDNKSSIQSGTGVTHRIAWDQGILEVFKWIL